MREDWLRDERGCRMLYEREDEIGQLGIRRVGVSTRGGKTELHDLCVGKMAVHSCA